MTSTNPGLCLSSTGRTVDIFGPHSAVAQPQLQEPILRFGLQPQTDGESLEGLWCLYLFDHRREASPWTYVLSHALAELVLFALVEPFSISFNFI